jgi:hypothetical protein
MNESNATENIYLQSHDDGNTCGMSVTHLEGTRDKFRPGKWLFVTSCNLESRFGCFRVTGYLHLQFGTLNLGPTVSSETSVPVHQTARRYYLRYSYLYGRRYPDSSYVSSK